MQGHRTGLATCILEDEKAAIRVHCFGHCINLCLQDITRTIKSIRDALDLVVEITKLIKCSPKRKMQKEVGPHKAPSLKPLCFTRWTVRTAAIDSVIKNYTTLLETLDRVSKGCDDYARMPGGQMALMKKFSTFFGLKFLHLVFSDAEQLPTTIQGKDTSIEDATHKATLLASFYQSQRTDAAFDKFYHSVVSDSEGKTDHPTLAGSWG